MYKHPWARGERDTHTLLFLVVVAAVYSDFFDKSFWGTTIIACAILVGRFLKAVSRTCARNSSSKCRSHMQYVPARPVFLYLVCSSAEVDVFCVGYMSASRLFFVLLFCPLCAKRANHLDVLGAWLPYVASMSSYAVLTRRNELSAQGLCSLLL